MNQPIMNSQRRKRHSQGPEQHHQRPRPMRHLTNCHDSKRETENPGKHLLLKSAEQKHCSTSEKFGHEREHREEALESCFLFSEEEHLSILLHTFLSFLEQKMMQSFPSFGSRD